MGPTRAGFSGDASSLPSVKAPASSNATLPGSGTTALPATRNPSVLSSIDGAYTRWHYPRSPDHLR
jgi:hypothetical protein